MQTINQPVSRLKQMAKKAVSFAALTAFFGVGALTASATGGTVVFNGIHNNDYGNGSDFPNLQVARSGEAQWATSTTAQPGDVVNVFLWDHNSGPDGSAVARNVTIKINIPSEVATSHTVTSVLDADNASAPVNGSVAISSVPTNTKLSYIPGSAKFFRNVNDQLTEVNFPAGVNKDNVVTTGINVGDQEACWHHSQAVLVQLRVEGGTPGILANKKVALAGGSAFTDSTNARPGDAVEFRILVENNGTASTTDTKVIDTLDSKLTYIPGSSSIRAKVNNGDVDVKIADSQIQRSGQTLTWSFGTMTPDDGSAFYLHFQARVNEAGQFQVGTTTIPNCAMATITGASANTNCVSVVVTREEDKVVTFTLIKRVSNVPGNGTFYDNVGTTPGAQVIYSLKLTNTGNTTAEQVTLKDILPAGVSYAGEAKLFNGQNPNGIAIDGNALTTGGYVFPSIANGTMGLQEIRFRANVTAACQNVELVNTGKVFYQGTEKAQATASVNVNCTPGLNIIKDIKDPATNQFVDVLPGFAREGQVLTYRIKVQNTGNVTAVHPILRDVLPPQVTYVRGSLTIDGIATNEVVQNSFINPNLGMMLTDFTTGMSKDIVFQVKVGDCPDSGDMLITNTAFVKANDIAEISDTARATIKVVQPTMPSM